MTEILGSIPPAVVGTGGEDMLFWGLGLLAASLLLIVVELFVPSGGLIAVLSAACALGGIACLFRQSGAWGMTGVLLVVVLGPVVGYFALRIYPNTPIGRKIIHGSRTEEQIEAERRQAQEAREQMLALIGLEGVALTDLRPVGRIEVEGRRLDALSETTLVKAGTRVRVTEVVDNQVKVRPLG